MKRDRIARIFLAAVVLALPGCRDRAEESPAPLADEPRAATGPADLAADSPDTGQVLTDPVTIQGRVVDAGTGAGIARAVVIVLEPGVSARQWAEAQGQEQTEELMEGAAVTDEEGRYEIGGLRRGGIYTVMVGSEGYRSAVFEAGLEVGPRDPPIMGLKAVELDRP